VTEQRQNYMAALGSPTAGRDALARADQVLGAFTRREAMSATAGLVLGCGPVRDAFTPRAEAQDNCDPRIALTQPSPRAAVRTPLGALAWVPLYWGGFTNEVLDALLAEIDTTVCEGPSDGSEGPVGETIGAFCARTGWEVWVGPPGAIELADGSLAAGYTCAASRSLVNAWTLTAHQAGDPRRLRPLSHESRHGRRYALGLDPCWPGHGPGCDTLGVLP